MDVLVNVTLRFCFMTHYDITIDNDVARDVHYDIIMGPDIFMGAYHYILMFLALSFIMYYYT